VANGGLFIVVVVVVSDFFFDVVEVVLIEGDFHESRQSGRRKRLTMCICGVSSLFRKKNCSPQTAINADISATQHTL